MGIKKIGVSLGSLLFSGLFLAGIVLAEGENLVCNGNFEEIGKDGFPASWSIPQSKGGGVAKLDSSIKHQGKNSLRLDLSEGEGERINVEVKSKEFPVKPESLYLITFWYKADGFKTKESKYLGANAVSWIYFKTADRKHIYYSRPPSRPWMANFPYSDVDWKIATWIVSAPQEAASAYYTFCLNTNDPKVVTPKVWLDNIRIREYHPLEAKGKVYTYEAKQIRASSKMVDDKDTEDGVAVLSIKGEQEPGYAFTGPYTTAQPPGQYKVIFRLKVADNGPDVQAYRVYVGANGCLNSTVNMTVIKASDFTAPNKYQEFSLEVIKPPSGWFEFQVDWLGEVTGWLDNIKVVEEKVFTDKEMAEIWE